MKISVTQQSKEEQAAQSKTDTLRPLSLTLTEDGGLSVLVHPSFLSLVEQIRTDAGQEDFDFFTLCDRLTTALSTELLTHGYQIDRKSTVEGYLLYGDQTTEKSLKTDYSSTSDILEVDIKGNLTTVSINKNEMEAACGIVHNGRLLSLAFASQVQEGRAEITVETAPAFRRRGYARASLAALTAKLLFRGILPVYRCRLENAASRALAEQVGYRRVGFFYQGIGRRIPHGI